MKIGNLVIVTGRDLTFMGRKFEGWTGEIVGKQTKHGERLLRVRFADQNNTEILFKPSNLRIILDE